MIAKQKVLVVDDEEIVRESFRLALTEAGYAVRTAGSGHDALKACREEPCDVMLADLKMPDMDGLQVTREVSSQFPNIRVVIVTGYPSPETYQEASQLGILDYLEKPISPERLSAATARALARTRQMTPPAVDATEFPATVEEPEEETVPALGETKTDDSVDKRETVAEPTVAARVEPATERPVIEADATPETEVSTLRALTLLALSPIMGLAFVVFLPMIGFGMLFAALGSVLGESLGIGRN
jgi:CheY-like chemotaxis protein